MGSRKKRLQRKTEAAVGGAPSEPVKHLPAVLMLVFAGLMWHGFLLTNDGLIWDSWYVYSWLANKNWGTLSEFFGSVGMPIYGWIYAPFAFAPDIVFAFMFATVFCLILQSLLIYRLGIRLGCLDPKEAFSLAILAQAMPVFTAGQDFIMFFFVLMLTLFLAAAWLAARCLELKGWTHYMFRCLAVVLFFISFYNAALLVFYGGFFILLFLKWRRGGGQSLIASAWGFVRAYPDLLLLPPVSWFLRGKLSPQFGWYESYNSPVENIPLIIPSLQSFFANVLPFHFSQLAQWVLNNPVPLAVIVLLTVALGLRGPRYLTTNSSKTSLWAMFGFGLLLLFFAIFPFAAAGKGFSPRPIGEPSRYTILTAVPLAILLFCLLKAVFLPKPTSKSRWFVPVCIGTAIVLGCQIPPVYLAERAEWIFSRSILHNAVKNDDVRRSSIIVLQGCGLSSEIVYGIYSFASAFGDFTRLVTPTIPQNRQFFSPSEIEMTLYRTTNLPNMLKDINPSGQQMLLEVERKRNDSSDGELAWKYLRIRLEGDRGEMDSFLESLTTLHTRVLKPETPLVPGISSLAPSPSNLEKAFSNSVGIEMVPTKEDFWVARSETTQSQYVAVMRSNPSMFVDPLRPVERVSWNDAAAFCAALNAAERRSGKLPPGFEYRLPSLDEMRVLSKGTPMSDSILAQEQIFWHTQPAASRGPNPLGLYDIIGNVWEWTDSWSDNTERLKLSVGGSFANTPAELALHPRRHEVMDFFSRAVMRRLFGETRQDYPDQAFWDRGFRVVLAPSQKP